MAIDEARIRDLIAKREAAEKAVEGTDPSLKEKAFEVMLQHLLAADAPQTGSKRRRRSKRPRTATGQKPTQKRSRKSSGPQANVIELVQEGFFGDWKSLAEIQAELEVKGHHYKQAELSPVLLGLTQSKTLRRERRDRQDGRKIWVYQRFRE
jgi:hypothetical protein